MHGNSKIEIRQRNRGGSQAQKKENGKKYSGTKEKESNFKKLLGSVGSRD